MKKRGFYLIFSVIYTISLVFFSWTLIGGHSEEHTLANAAISTGLTAVALDQGSSQAVRNGTESGKNDAKIQPAGSKTETSHKQSDTSKSSKSKSSKSASGDPLVLIYHTHGTESYLPAKSGNYHTTKEENTVRDVGNILEESLAEEGIASIHDKTIHDNPSYDGSYDRSYNCIQKILADNPSIVCIIDLHRDAIAGDYTGDTAIVDGRTAATYSYVLSNTTETYSSNKEFLSRLNSIASSDFDGYTGKVLERPYWYNQEICGKAVLIEMGNNRNQIEDVRNTAWFFGKILARALE